ncbi:MAG: RDD family protein [Ilumatobacter sp.]|nr:RDD family protein [Ilumatobacter sp.]
MNIRYLPASIVQRVGALVVDALLFACLVLVPTTLIAWWFGPEARTYCEFRNGSESCRITPEALRYIRGVFWPIAAVFVLVYSRAIATGASIGKKATEIIVVDAETARPISYGRAVARTVLSVVSVAAFGLGLLMIVTNRERRALHDYIMRTRVISP